MTLWIKNRGYALSLRLDLMLSVSLSKEFKLLQILKDLSLKHFIRLISYENDVKLLKFRRRPVSVDLSHFSSVKF